MIFGARGWGAAAQPAAAAHGSAVGAVLRTARRRHAPHFHRAPSKRPPVIKGRIRMTAPKGLCIKKSTAKAVRAIFLLPGKKPAESNPVPSDTEPVQPLKPRLKIGVYLLDKFPPELFVKSAMCGKQEQLLQSGFLCAFSNG